MCESLYRWQRNFRKCVHLLSCSSQCHLGETTEMLKRFLWAAGEEGGSEGSGELCKYGEILQTPADFPTAGGGWVRTQTASQTDRTANCENSPPRRPLFLSVQHPLLFHMTETNNLPLVQNWQQSTAGWKDHRPGNWPEFEIIRCATNALQKSHYNFSENIVTVIILSPTSPLLSISV